MNEQPLTYAELPPLAPPAMPEARIWATSTDLAGTDKERKQYFFILDDGEKRIQFVLHVHADGLIRAVPYAEPDYDYTQYDDEDDYESIYYEDDDCEVSGDDEPDDTEQEEA